MSRVIAAVAVVLVLVAALVVGPSTACRADTGSLDLGRPGDDPVAAGSWTFDWPTNTHTVMGGGSDWWDGGEYAHFAYASVTGDFWLESQVEWVNRTGNWNDMDFWVKAGVAVRNTLDVGAGNEKDVNYFTAYLRPDRNEAAFQGRTVATSNMFNYQIGGMPAQPAKVALNRWTDAEGDVLVQGLVDRGAGWEVINSQWAPNLAANAYAGMAVTAHQNDGRLETAKFHNTQFMAAVVPTGPLPRKIGAAINDPEHVAPVMGGWGVVEVVDNGNMDNLDNAISSIQGGGGNRHRYNLMGALNINDHEGNYGSFASDRGYGVVYAGIKTAGQVDHIAMLARGTVTIPTAGDWTFYSLADDGVELSIDHKILQTIRSESWDARNFMTVNLTAGPHDIQVLHRGGSGGENIEVAAARGNTANLREFNLIGSGAPARPAYSVWVPGYEGLVNLEATKPGNYLPGNRDQALQAILDGRAAGTNSTGTADRINHADPENAGGGQFGGNLAFPNDSAGDDNDFAFLAKGKLVVPTAATYYLGFDSDDGAALQIAGQTWTGIVANATGAAVIDGDWLKTDAWTGSSYTVGQILLAAGSYDFQFVSYEGGGGAFAEVFGSSEQGNYYMISSGQGQQVVVPEAVAALNLVPEPGTLSLLALGGLGLALMAWRRRKADR